MKKLSQDARTQLASALKSQSAANEVADALDAVLAGLDKAPVKSEQLHKELGRIECAEAASNAVWNVHAPTKSGHVYGFASPEQFLGVVHALRNAQIRIADLEKIVTERNVVATEAPSVQP